MQEAFSRTYEARFVREQPGLPEELCHYPTDIKAGGEGRIVRIMPHGAEPWLAVFAFGATGGSDRLFTCPHPDWLCVVARNAAYLVDAHDPERWARVNAGAPIVHVVPSTDANLLLFADHTHIEAWGPNGFAWRSAPLSYDGLRHLRLDGMLFRGEGWYPDAWEAFTLDLRNGRHEGGHDKSLLEPGRPPGLWRRLLWGLGVFPR